MGVVAFITIFAVGEFSYRFQFGIQESRDSLLFLIKFFKMPYSKYCQTGEGEKKVTVLY